MSQAKNIMAVNTSHKYAKIRSECESVFLKQRPEQHNHVLTNVSAVCKTNIAACKTCWYDTEPLDPSKPVVSVPVAYNKTLRQYLTTGVFCSYQCAFAYICDWRVSAGRARLDCVNMLMTMWRATGRKDMLRPAKHWSVLKKFGGVIDIDEYRQHDAAPNNWTATLPADTRLIHAGYTSFLFDDTPVVPRSKADEPKEVPTIAVPDISKLKELSDEDKKRLAGQKLPMKPRHRRLTAYNKKQTPNDMARAAKRKTDESMFEVNRAKKKTKTDAFKNMLGIKTISDQPKKK